MNHFRTMPVSNSLPKPGEIEVDWMSLQPEVALELGEESRRLIAENGHKMPTNFNLYLQGPDVPLCPLSATMQEVIDVQAAEHEKHILASGGKAILKHVVKLNYFPEGRDDHFMHTDGDYTVTTALDLAGYGDLVIHRRFPLPNRHVPLYPGRGFTVHTGTVLGKTAAYHGIEKATPQRVALVSRTIYAHRRTRSN